MYVIKTSRAPRIFITAKNCPECGSEKFYHSRHEAFCSSCSFAIVEE